MNSTRGIAENHIRITRALFQEGMRAVTDNSYRKSIRAIALCLMILFGAAAAWLIYTGGSLIFLLGEAIFLGALFFWLIVLLPNTSQRRKYRAMMQGTDSIPERKIVFYQGYLSVTANSGKQTTVQYSDVSAVQETRNLYILNCRNHANVLLDKNGFVSGNIDRVKQLIDGAA